MLLNDVHFINFVPVWLFLLVSGSFQSVYNKSTCRYSGPTVLHILCESCKTPVVVCPKHAFMSCWIVVQYVARVLSSVHLYF